MTRFLRPAALAATPDAVWAVDGFQPVDVRLDPVDSALLGVVDRSDQPPLPPGTSRPTVVADDGCWVQRGDLLVRLGPDGVELTTNVDGLSLLIAHGPDAWLAAAPFVQVGEPHRGIDAPPLRPERLVRVRPDGGRHEVALDRPVHHRGVAEETGLRLQIVLAPPTAVPSGAGGYGFDHHQVTVLVPWADLERDRVAVSLADPVAWAAPPAHISWLRDAGPGRRVDDLVWHVRWDLAGDRVHRSVLAVTGGRRVSLGRGSVLAASAGAGALWCAVARRKGGMDVVAVEPGAARAVLAGDVVDITARCWALPARPDDADAHVARWVELLSHLDTCDPHGPLVEGLSDSRAEPDGTWPDLGVRVTFRHPWFPGGLLTRRIRLFDELGRIADPGHPSIHLMEDLDTRMLPPLSEAVDGVLSI